jgi:hypothetical protein
LLALGLPRNLGPTKDDGILQGRTFAGPEGIPRECLRFLCPFKMHENDLMTRFVIYFFLVKYIELVIPNSYKYIFISTIKFD